MNKLRPSLPMITSLNSPPTQGQAGVTLVELMIAITVGLFLVTGMTVLITQQSSTRAELQKSAQQIENGRYAMQLIQEDAQLAGYYGEYSDVFSVPGALPDPCSTSAPATGDLAIPVQGYDSVTALPAPISGCIADSDHLTGTDILAIRRLDPASIPIAGAVASQIYMQTGIDSVSGLFGYKIGTGSDTSVFTLQNKDGTVADLRPYIVHIYFISPCSVPAGGASSCTGSDDDNGNPIPTLKRLELVVSGGSSTFLTYPLAEGIENLQVDYGVDNDNDGAPDYYTTGTYEKDGATAMTPTDWSNIMSIDVNLLARNTELSPGYTTDKQYKLGLSDAVGPYTDHYKRHAFNGTIRLINPSSRREK